MTTPISREILMVANVPLPSLSRMQKTANNVFKMVEKINRESMRDIREKLVQENDQCGMSNKIMLESSQTSDIYEWYHTISGRRRSCHYNVGK